MCSTSLHTKMRTQMLIQIKHQAGQPQIEIFTLTCILFTIELITVNNRFAYDAFYAPKKFARIEYMGTRTQGHVNTKAPNFLHIESNRKTWPNQSAGKNAGSQYLSNEQRENTKR